MPVLSHAQVMFRLIVPLGDSKQFRPGGSESYSNYGEGTGGAFCVVEHPIQLDE